MSIASTVVGLVLSNIMGNKRKRSIGEAVFEEVVGRAAGGPLNEEVEELDPEIAEEWARVMQDRLEFFEAQTERIVAEQGLVDKDTLSVLSIEDRGRVAWLRMTTRPWAVRWMIIGLMAPFLVVTLDVVFWVLNMILGAIQFDKLVNGGNDWPAYDFRLTNVIFTKPELATFYNGFKGWASAIVISYFGLREVGKWRGQDDEASVSGVIADAKSVVKKARENGQGAIGALKKIRDRLF
ncbi:MAG: hypothetical protein AAF429_02320 [Pseudomonadota bacterium]